MCFYIHKRHSTVKIATKNITCYKKLSIDVFSITRFPFDITEKTFPTIKFRTPFRDSRVSLHNKPLKTSPLKVNSFNWITPDSYPSDIIEEGLDDGYRIQPRS